MLLFPWDLPVDTSRPVLHVLTQAGAENFEAFVDTLTKAGIEANRPLSERIGEADLMQMAVAALAHAKSVVEILGWIVPLKPPLGSVEAAARAEVQFSMLGQDEVDKMAARMQKLPAHRPSKRRQSHIAAFEFMLRSERNSLGQAVRKFCLCGGRHSIRCHANLKAGIRVLKRMLRRYAPELVSQYDVLHPDRKALRRIK